MLARRHLMQFMNSATKLERVAVVAALDQAVAGEQQGRRP